MPEIMNFGRGDLLPHVAGDVRAIGERLHALLAAAPRDGQAIERELAALNERLLPAELGTWLRAEFGTEDIVALPTAIVATPSKAGGKPDPDDRFDYADLPTDAVVELRLCEELIAEDFRQIEERALSIGRTLLRAQKTMARRGCGNFSVWVEHCTPISRSQAYRLIDYANAPEQRRLSPRGDKLSLKAALLLAAPSTPDTVITAVSQRVDAGERVTAAEVERLKREAREEAERQARAEITAERNRLEAEKREALEAATAARDKAQAEARRLSQEIARLTTATDEARQAGAREAALASQAAVDRAKAEAEAARAALAQAEAVARSAQTEADAAAKAKAEALAEEALASRKRELAELERKAKAAARSVETCQQNEQRLRADVERHQAYLARTREPDHEAPYQIEAATALSDALLAALTALDGFDFPPPPDVARQWEAAARRCRQLAEAIDHHLAPRLVVVTNNP